MHNNTPTKIADWKANKISFSLNRKIAICTFEKHYDRFTEMCTLKKRIIANKSTVCKGQRLGDYVSYLPKVDLHESFNFL